MMSYRSQSRLSDLCDRFWATLNWFTKIWHADAMSIEEWLWAETRNELSAVRRVNGGAVDIKRERSGKELKSTNLKNFNSLQHSAWCSFGFFMPSDYDDSATKHLVWTYGLFILLLEVCFLLPFSRAVLFSSLLGKYWTTWFEMFDCCLS